jgi:Skp family chaperone for outer membrane proteins
MKNIFTGLIISAMLLSFIFGLPAEARDISTIGYINVTQVFKDYKESKKAQDELEKKEKDFKKEFEKKQEELEQAQAKGKSRSEIEDLRKKLEDDLSPKRDQLLALNERLTQKIQQDIVKAVERVAKRTGIEVVVDKQVIITGGMDLTDMVVSELNK